MKNEWYRELERDFGNLTDSMISYMYKYFYLPQAVKDKDEKVYSLKEFRYLIYDLGFFELDVVEGWFQSKWNEIYENLPEIA